MLVSSLCAMGIFGIPSKHFGRIIYIYIYIYLFRVFLKYFERMLVICRFINVQQLFQNFMLLMNSSSWFVVFRGLVAMWWLCETVLQRDSKLSQSERDSRSLAETGYFLRYLSALFLYLFLGTYFLPSWEQFYGILESKME